MKTTVHNKIAKTHAGSKSLRDQQSTYEGGAGASGRGAKPSEAPAHVVVDPRTSPMPGATRSNGEPEIIIVHCRNLRVGDRVVKWGEPVEYGLVTSNLEGTICVMWDDGQLTTQTWRHSRYNLQKAVRTVELWERATKPGRPPKSITG